MRAKCRNARILGLGSKEERRINLDASACACLVRIVLVAKYKRWGS